MRSVSNLAFCFIYQNFDLKNGSLFQVAFCFCSIDMFLVMKFA